MIKTVDRYLFKSVSFALLFAVLLFLSLDVLFAIIAELNDINGNYSIGDVFYFVVLTVPGRIYELFPLSAVVGVVIGLGTLAAGSELVVMLASGMSRLRVALTVILCVGCWLIFIVLMGEFVSPSGEKMANSFRSQEISSGQGIATDASVWIKDDSIIFNAQRLIKNAESDGYRLENVTVFEFEGAQVRKISRAKTAIFANNSWLLQGLEVSLFNNQRVVVEKIEQQRWDSRIEPEILNISLTRPKNLSLRDISALQEFAGEDKQLLSSYQIARWSKWFFPFFVLATALTGVLFVFGQVRSGGFAQRLVFGAMLGVILYLLNKTMLNIGEVYHTHPAVVVVLPSVCVAVLSLWLLFRANRLG